MARRVLYSVVFKYNPERYDVISTTHHHTRTTVTTLFKDLSKFPHAQSISQCLNEAFAKGEKYGFLEGYLQFSTKTPDLSVTDAIEELDLTVRSYNALKREGIHTIGDLIAKSEQDLLDIRNFGAKSIDEVKDKLHAADFSLRRMRSS